MSDRISEKEINPLRESLERNEFLQLWMKQDNEINEDYPRESDLLFCDDDKTTESDEDIGDRENYSDDFDSMSSSIPLFDTSDCYKESTYIDEVRKHFSKSTESTSSNIRLYENVEEEHCDPSELVEFRDKSWVICIRADLYLKNQEEFEMTVYSYQRGIEKIRGKSYQIRPAVKSASMIKYKKNNSHLNIEPIHCSLSVHPWISVKVRFNKGMEVKCYAITNFSGFDSDKMFEKEVIIWSDSVGAIRLNGQELSCLWRSCGEVQDAFSALSLSHITVKADFKFESGIQPKWTVTNIQPARETNDEGGTLKIGVNLWPARVYRFDDLLFEKKENKHYVFKSISMKDVVVTASRSLREIIHSAGPKYGKKGVMTAVAFPVYESGEFSHYEALVIGPLKVVMMVTEGRLLNYTRRTFPPHQMKVLENLRKKKDMIHEFDHRNLPGSYLDKHAWDIPHNCRSLRGSFEI